MFRFFRDVPTTEMQKQLFYAVCVCVLFLIPTVESGWSAVVDNVSTYGNWITCFVLNGSSEFYFGGTLANINNTNFNGIVYWNGFQWQSLSNVGIVSADHAYTLAINGSTLFVGGDFVSLSDGRTLAQIVTWDQQNGWNPVANGIDGTVWCAVIRNQILYIGGSFGDFYS